MPSQRNGRRLARNTITKRPAETTALSAAVALLLAKYVFNITDAATITAIAVVIGAIPAVVTGLVEHYRKVKDAQLDEETYGGSE